jgi:AcrR family transcriptional regulator
MAVKGFREPLSRERVLAAAVALADTEGIKALTMRRLAADLGVEAMSLYYHLPGKEALLDGVVESNVTEIHTATAHQTRTTPATLTASAATPTAATPTAGSSTAGGDWRTRLRSRFLAARGVMLRHPWAPGLLGSRPSIPAGVYAYYDEIVATLAAAGFSYRLAHRAVHALGSMPLGFVQELFSPASAGGSMDADVAEADLVAMAEALPHLTAMVTTEIHDATDPTLGWCDSQTEFEFTLDLLLNGLEHLRARLPPPAEAER